MSDAHPRQPLYEMFRIGGPRVRPFYIELNGSVASNVLPRFRAEGLMSDVDHLLRFSELVSRAAGHVYQMALSAHWYAQECAKRRVWRRRIPQEARDTDLLDLACHEKGEEFSDGRWSDDLATLYGAALGAVEMEESLVDLLGDDVRTPRTLLYVLRGFDGFTDANSPPKLEGWEAANWHELACSVHRFGIEAAHKRDPDRSIGALAEMYRHRRLLASLDVRLRREVAEARTRCGLVRSALDDELEATAPRIVPASDNAQLAARVAAICAWAQVQPETEFRAEVFTTKYGLARGRLRNRNTQLRKLDKPTIDFREVRPSLYLYRFGSVVEHFLAHFEELKQLCSIPSPKENQRKTA